MKLKTCFHLMIMLCYSLSKLNLELNQLLAGCYYFVVQAHFSSVQINIAFSCGRITSHTQMVLVRTGSSFVKNYQSYELQVCRFRKAKGSDFDVWSCGTLLSTPTRCHNFTKHQCDPLDYVLVFFLYKWQNFEQCSFSIKLFLTKLKIIEIVL